MRKNYLAFLFALSILLCHSTTMLGQKVFTLKSPGGNLEANISVGKTIEYSVSHKGDLMLDKSALSMKLTDGTALGADAKLRGTSTKTVNDEI